MRKGFYICFGETLQLQLQKKRYSHGLLRPRFKDLHPFGRAEMIGSERDEKKMRKEKKQTKKKCRGRERAKQ